MTRRNIIFKSQNGKLYVSPEFNGDKREFELRKGCLDGYSKNWEDVIAEFEGITTLDAFEKQSRLAQSYGYTFIGEVEILPVVEISDIDEVKNDKVYIIENGKTRLL